MARIGRESLLRRIFGTIIVTPAVWDEALAPSRDAAVLADARWLIIRAPTDAAYVQRLMVDLRLGRGEAESIALAVEQHSIVAIDEKRGRSRATQLGLRVTGLIGILQYAKTSGLIDRIAPILDQLEETGFYMSQALRQQLLENAGESG